MVKRNAKGIRRRVGAAADAVTHFNDDYLEPSAISAFAADSPAMPAPIITTSGLLGSVAKAQYAGSTLDNMTASKTNIVNPRIIFLPRRATDQRPSSSKRGGRLSIQGRAASKAAEARMTVASPKWRPTICKPTGKPSAVNPAGIDAAGWPVIFIG